MFTERLQRDFGIRALICIILVIAFVAFVFVITLCIPDKELSKEKIGIISVFSNIVTAAITFYFSNRSTMDQPPTISGNGSNFVYYVKSGDTLWKIAQEFNTSVDAICKVNDINPNKVIYTGEKLTIPGSGTTAPPEYYTVQDETTLTDVAQKWGIKDLDLAQLNNINCNAAIHPGQILRVK